MRKAAWKHECGNNVSVEIKEKKNLPKVRRSSLFPPVKTIMPIVTDCTKQISFRFCLDKEKLFFIDFFSQRHALSHQLNRKTGFGVETGPRSGAALLCFLEKKILFLRWRYFKWKTTKVKVQVVRLKAYQIELSLLVACLSAKPKKSLVIIQLYNCIWQFTF